MIRKIINTLVRGLYVLLPLMLLWIGIREIGAILATMAEPIADLIGSKYFENLLLPGVVATILIAGTSLIIGMLAKLRIVSTVGAAMETHILNRVPMYRMLKLISSALVRPSESDVVPAIVLDGDGDGDGDGGGDPCYVMETHGNGLSTVLIPWSPASFAGTIKIVPTARLQTFDCTIDEYSRSISLMGVGIAECMARTSTSSGQGGSKAQGS